MYVIEWSLVRIGLNVFLSLRLHHIFLPFHVGYGQHENDPHQPLHFNYSIFFRELSHYTHYVLHTHTAVAPVVR